MQYKNLGKSDIENCIAISTILTMVMTQGGPAMPSHRVGLYVHSNTQGPILRTALHTQYYTTLHVHNDSLPPPHI